MSRNERAGVCRGIAAPASSGGGAARFARWHVVPAAWSMLLRVADFGLDGAETAARLLQQGVYATME